MAKTSLRKKLALIPPIQMFPSGSVQVANAGINSTSFAPGSIDSNAIAPTARGQIKSIQRGVISMGVTITTNTATLSPAVDVTKTELRFLGYACSGPASNGAACAILTLTNGTTVTAARTTTDGDTIALDVSWEITERY